MLRDTLAIPTQPKITKKPTSKNMLLPIVTAKIIKSGRLQPGKMFLVDLAKGKIVSDEELKKEI